MSLLLRGERESKSPRAHEGESTQAVQGWMALLSKGLPLRQAPPPKPRKSTAWHPARVRTFLRTLTGWGRWWWWWWCSHPEFGERGRKHAGEEMTTEKRVRVRDGEIVPRATGPF